MTMQVKEEILYQKIANILNRQIKDEVLKVGDKLPSIRTVQQVYQVSINTVKQAFLELESKGMIESNPSRAIMFASLYNGGLRCLLSAAQSYRQRAAARRVIPKVFATLSKSDITQFSLGVPDIALLPLAK